MESSDLCFGRSVSCEVMLARSAGGEEGRKGGARLVREGRSCG